MNLTALPAETCVPVDSALACPGVPAVETHRGDYRTAMRFLFYALLSVSVMLNLVWASPIRLVVPFGTSQLRETDLLLLAFVGLWAVKVTLNRTRLSGDRVPKLIYLLILVVTLPMLTGLASGKPLGVVLRDFRTPVFFLSMLPMLDVLRTYADLRSLARFMIVVGTISLMAGIPMWLIGSQAAYIPVGQYRFGITSATNFCVWLVFLAIAFAGLSKVRSPWRKWAWLYVISQLLLVFFANDNRSIYGGALGGLLFLGIALSLKGKGLGVRRRAQMLVRVGFFCLVLLASLLSLVASYGVDLEAAAMRDMRISRLSSVLFTDISETVGSYAGSNRDDRMLGLSYGLDLGTRNAGLGVGYGDNPFVDLDERIVRFLFETNRLAGNPGNTIENLLLTHNSYGWAFGRLGLWLALTYFLLILLICYRAWKALVSTSSAPMRIILLGTLAFVVNNLLLGFGGGAFFDYTGQGLVVWLVCLAVLIRSTSLAQHARALPEVPALSQFGQQLRPADV